MIDAPSSFSGGKTHDILETIYFLTFLKGKNHQILFKTDEPSLSGTIENFEVSSLDLQDLLTLKLENQAEDGNQRPWLTFVLDNLPLKSFVSSVSFAKREKDSDDIKIILDGKPFGNLLHKIRYLWWYYVGSRGSGIKNGTETFNTNLPLGLHYLEFWADRMPILHFLTLNFGKKPLLPVGIPTVEKPKRTKDFADDTEEMLIARLIYGEAGGESQEAKIWVGGVVLNRVASSSWPNTIHGVILQPNQFDPFKNSDPNFPKITDPLGKANERDAKARNLLKLIFPTENF